MDYPAVLSRPTYLTTQAKYTIALQCSLIICNNQLGYWGKSLTKIDMLRIIVVPVNGTDLINCMRKMLKK